MAALSAKSRHYGGKIAALSRSRNPDDPEIVAARQGLAYQQLADRAARVVADWPSPTPDQVAKVVAILQSGGAA